MELLLRPSFAAGVHEAVCGRPSGAAAFRSGQLLMIQTTQTNTTTPVTVQTT